MPEKESVTVQENRLKSYSLVLLMILSSNVLAFEKKSLGFNASLTALSNLSKRSDFRHSSLSLFGLGSSYKLNDKHSLSLSFRGIKELSGDYELSNETLSLAHSHKLGSFKDFAFVTGQSILIPINTAMRVDQTLRGNFSANISASRSFKFLVPFDLSLALSGTKSFHKLETNSERGFNTSHLFTFAPSLSFSLLDKLGLNIGASVTEAYDYAGTRKENYAFENSLSYAFSKQFNMSLGLSIGGATYIARGNDFNVRLFDSEQSEAYLSMAYSF